uniref:Uncharacterized protein n=1 Tax=Panagrellus redivivus TaxID=6233 RepID=A0A7E4WAN8_PANRE
MKETRSYKQRDWFLISKSVRACFSSSCRAITRKPCHYDAKNLFVILKSVRTYQPPVEPLFQNGTDQSIRYRLTPLKQASTRLPLLNQPLFGRK